jgi:hypothetical protein
MRTRIQLIGIALVAVAAAGCGHELKVATRQDIDGQVRALKPALSECYRQALERNPQLRGMATLAFMVAPESGQVGEVRVLSSEITDEQLKQCVVGRAAAMRVMQVHPRPIEVSYPLNFVPSGPLGI